MRHTSGHMHLLPQELQQLVKLHQDQCAALAEHRSKYEALQQQHALLQSSCQQLQGDLLLAQDALTVREQSEHQKHSQIVQPKSARVFSMQASSGCGEPCIADQVGTQQTKMECTVLDSGEAQPSRNNTQEMGSNTGDALLCLQQLAEQTAVLSLQQDMLLMGELAGLHALEDTLENALKNVQSASRQKSLTEVSKLRRSVKQMEQTVEDYIVCPLCMERDQECVLSCGHQLCAICSDSLYNCPFCRKPVKTCIKVFRV